MRDVALNERRRAATTASLSKRSSRDIARGPLCVYSGSRGVYQRSCPAKEFADGIIA
jgi:hypothetical protein